MMGADGAEREGGVRIGQNKKHVTYVVAAGLRPLVASAGVVRGPPQDHLASPFVLLRSR